MNAKIQKVKDKITGLSGIIEDVSCNTGDLKVFVKLDNGERISRKINELEIPEQEK